MKIKFYKNESNNELFETITESTETQEGQTISQVAPNTVDAAIEKHVPVVSYSENEVLVSIGEVAHPMEDSHYIQWVEIVGEDFVMRKYLVPGDKPETTFQTSTKNVKAYIYCNLHGLWESK